MAPTRSSATAVVAALALLISPAAAYGHYPDRAGAPAYFTGPCSAGLQFVVDYGEVFSDAFGPTLEQLTCSVARNFSAEIVIATVHDIGHDNLPSYAEGLFQTWNIGGIREVGVLLLFSWEYGSTGQPAVWLHIGRGLSGALGPEERQEALQETRIGFEKNLRRGLEERAAIEIGLARGATALGDSIAGAHGQSGFPPATSRPGAPLSFWTGTLAFLALMAAMGTAAVALEVRRSGPELDLEASAEDE